MYVAVCSHYPAQNVETYVNGQLLSYLAALYRNGQILRRRHTVHEEGCIRVYCALPDDDAITDRYSSARVVDSLGDLLRASEREPECVILGASAEVDSSVCVCASPSLFVLYTDVFRLAPPVICGDCGGHVPLYKLPFPNDDDDYYDILMWEQQYRACALLDVLSTVGEAFGAHQTQDPRSELSTVGRGLCQDLSTKLERPFYYHIACGDQADAQGRCPGCDSEWDTIPPVCGQFYRNCVRCGLVG